MQSQEISRAISAKAGALLVPHRTSTTACLHPYRCPPEGQGCRLSVSTTTSSSEATSPRKWIASVVVLSVSAGMASMAERSMCHAWSADGMVEVGGSSASPSLSLSHSLLLSFLSSSSSLHLAW